MEIELAKYRLRLKFLEECPLPRYKGTTFRGAFGSVFKNTICVNKYGVCEDCLLKEKCAYSYVFETPVPEDSERMRLYTYAPHPFVIEPPQSDRQIFSKDEEVDINLVVLGKAIGYLPYFVYTFVKMGNAGLGRKRGKFELLNISNEISGEEIFNPSSGKLKQHKPISINLSNNSSRIGNNIKFNFITPVRIKYEDSLLDDLEFHILIRNLLRRLSNICYFHNGKKLDVDFNELIHLAEDVKKKSDSTRWIEFERYSTRQNTNMKMGGIVGEIEFEGDLSPFSGYLEAGKYIHIGKLTGFGFGKYSLER